MKRTVLLFIIIILASVHAFAGPFVSIKSIDAGARDSDVNLEVSVVGIDNGALRGLDEDHLKVYENGYRVNYVKVTDMSSEQDNLYLVFAVDSSKSIGEKFIKKIKNNAKFIVRGAAPGDRIALYRFNDKVKLLTNFTVDRNEIIKGIKSVKRHGSKTMLYDSIYDSISLVSKIESSRNAVIVFTDGTDDGSSLKLEDVVLHSKQNRVPVYFVTLSGARGRKKISRIAKLTGGRVYYIDSHSGQNIYGKILSSIKSIYRISYKSMADTSAGEHRVEVRLKHGDLKDRDSKIFSFNKTGLNLKIFNDISGLVKVLWIIFATLVFVFIMAYVSRLLKRQKKLTKEPVLEDNYYYDPDITSDILDEDNEEYDGEHPREVPDVMYSEAWIQKRGGDCNGEKIPLIKGDAVIGIERSNRIPVDDEDVSSHHARIRRIEGGYYIYDLVSDQGTYLNGKRLLRPRLLHDWDEIKVGSTLFIFRGVR